MSEILLVEKAYAYATRATTEDRQLLVFDHPASEKGIEVPKGGVEDDEAPAEAVVRELREETGIDDARDVEFLTRDTWNHPRKPKQYRRHFYHVSVAEPRDEWTHVVTGQGSDAGDRYRCFFADPDAVVLDDDMGDYLADVWR